MPKCVHGFTNGLSLYPISLVLYNSLFCSFILGELRLTASQVEDLLKENFYLQISGSGSSNGISDTIDISSGIASNASAGMTVSDVISGDNSGTSVALRGRMLLQQAGPPQLEGTSVKAR